MRALAERAEGRGLRGPVSLLTLVTSGSSMAWTLPGDSLRAPGHARQLVAEATRALPDVLVGDLVAVTSELVANAVLHTRSGHTGGTVSVGLQIEADAVTLVVADQGRQDGRCPEVAPALRVETGRGLLACREMGELTWECLPAGHCVRVRLDVAEVPR